MVSKKLGRKALFWVAIGGPEKLIDASDGYRPTFVDFNWRLITVFVAARPLVRWKQSLPKTIWVRSSGRADDEGRDSSDRRKAALWLSMENPEYPTQPVRRTTYPFLFLSVNLVEAC